MNSLSCTSSLLGPKGLKSFWACRSVIFMARLLAVW
jgi:hypothetical protein